MLQKYFSYFNGLCPKPKGLLPVCLWQAIKIRLFEIATSNLLLASHKGLVILLWRYNTAMCSIFTFWHEWLAIPVMFYTFNCVILSYSYLQLLKSVILVHVVWAHVLQALLLMSVFVLMVEQIPAVKVRLIFYNAYCYWLPSSSLVIHGIHGALYATGGLVWRNDILTELLILGCHLRNATNKALK